MHEPIEPSLQDDALPTLHAAMPRRRRPLTALLALGVTGALAAALVGCGSSGNAEVFAAAAREAAAAPTAASAPVHLRVIAFNDFHGNLEPAELSLTLADPADPSRSVRVPTGGVAALAGTVQALRAGAPNSVVVSTGDLISASPLISSMFRHEPTIEAMNTLGLDIAVVGNHEFDHGVLELQRLIAGGCATNAPNAPTTSCALHPYSGARFGYLAANVERADLPPGPDGKPQTLFPAFEVRRYGGVAVGFIGVVTRTTPGIVLPSGTAGLRFTDEADAINRAATALKAQGVNAIVALIHEGAETNPGTAGGPRTDWNDPQCNGASGPIFDIAKRVTPAVALLMTAHTHQGYRCIVDGRPIMQAVSYGRGVSVADLTIDPLTGAIDPTKTVSRNLPVFNARTDPALRAAMTTATPQPFADALRAAKPDLALAEQIAGYAKLAAPQANRPVGRITASFDRNGPADSSAGRLIADAQLAATRDPARGGAELALMNAGGIRADLPCRPEMKSTKTDPKPAGKQSGKQASKKQKVTTATAGCTVSFNDIYTMQPFNNTLVVVTLTGAQLKELLEGQQRPGAAQPNFMSPSASLSYRWNSRAPFGERVHDLKVNGRAVTPQQSLRVTVNSYMADGGDGLAVLHNASSKVAGGEDLEALTAYLSQAARTPDTKARVVVQQ